MSARALLITTLLLLPTAAAAQGLGWERYDSGRFGYSVDLPTELFEIGTVADNGDGLSLTEVGGDAELSVYGAYNAEGLAVDAFADVVEEADRIREVTYRTGGRTWFVLSGYYRREGDEREDLIFYAKFMFSADLGAVSAFEISYPQTDKRRFDPIVERLEESLTAPR